MSSYLIKQIASHPSIQVHREHGDLPGGGRRPPRTADVARNPATGEIKDRRDDVVLHLSSAPGPDKHLFGLARLPSSKGDQHGSVLTGPDLLSGGQRRPSGWALPRDPYHLEAQHAGCLRGG